MGLPQGEDVLRGEPPVDHPLGVGDEDGPLAAAAEARGGGELDQGPEVPQALLQAAQKPQGPPFPAVLPGAEEEVGEGPVGVAARGEEGVAEGP